MVRRSVRVPDAPEAAPPEQRDTTWLRLDEAERKGPDEHHKGGRTEHYGHSLNSYFNAASTCAQHSHEKSLRFKLTHYQHF
jgi:hypothetical protein